MAKRLREFRRFALTAKTGELLRSDLVDKTLNDHYGSTKCEHPDSSEPCVHERSGSLAVARMVEAGIKIGEKRATLDVPDPYCVSDTSGTIKTLRTLAHRLRSFAGAWKRQQQIAATRLADEIEAYADRNPLTVLADYATEAD